MDENDIQRILEEQRKQAAIYQKTDKQINSTISANHRAQDPEWIKKITEINRARQKDENFVKKKQEIMNSDAYKKAHRAGLNTESYKKLKSEQTKKLWNDEEYRAKHIAGMANPESRERQKKKAQEREADPEYKKKKKEWSAKLKYNKERSEKISNSRKEFIKNNPEYLKQMKEHNKKIANARTKEEVDAIIDKRAQNNWLEKTKEAHKKRRRPVVTPEGIFPSRIDWAEHVNLTAHSFTARLTRHPEQYYYITQEEYIMLTGKEL